MNTDNVEWTESTDYALVDPLLRNKSGVCRDRIDYDNSEFIDMDIYKGVAAEMGHVFKDMVKALAKSRLSKKHLPVLKEARRVLRSIKNKFRMTREIDRLEREIRSTR